MVDDDLQQKQRLLRQGFEHPGFQYLMSELQIFADTLPKTMMQFALDENEEGVQHTKYIYKVLTDLLPKKIEDIVNVGSEPATRWSFWTWLKRFTS